MSRKKSTDYEPKPEDIQEIEFLVSICMRDYETDEERNARKSYEYEKFLRCGANVIPKTINKIKNK